MKAMDVVVRDEVSIKQKLTRKRGLPALSLIRMCQD